MDVPIGQNALGIISHQQSNKNYVRKGIW
jgi:hypothetical protein